MNSSDRITRRFNMFYDEIDSQMSRLRTSDSISTKLSVQSDDAKLLSKMESGDISMAAVDNLIKTAKEFDEELKTYIEKNNLRKKVLQRKTRPTSMKSMLPPIWDDAKLNEYIDSIISDVFEPMEDTQVEEAAQAKNPPVTSPVPIIKPILKTSKLKPSQRNVGANVQFQLHPSTTETSSKYNSKPKPSTKDKSQKISGSIFPCRTDCIGKSDESVDIDCGKPLNKSTKLQSVPSNMKYSPLTKTSTAGRHGSEKPSHVTLDNEVDVVKEIDTNLATKSTQKAKQMTSRVLPVVSIKGSCSIQKIYQLEISPSHDVQFQTREDDTRRLNTKFIEYVYEPSLKPFKMPLNETEEILSQFATSSPAIPQINVQNAPKKNIFDIRDVNRVLNDFGVKLRDGKVHVVVERSRKRKANKTVKLGKSLKPSTLTKFIQDKHKTKESEVDGNENKEKKINIFATNKDDAAFKYKHKDEDKEAINMADSSMSSSITDDGKLRQILKIHRDVEKCNSSSDSYPGSSGNCETSVPHQTMEPNANIELSLTENFQSIYRLIEDTFKPIVETEATPEINENAQEILDGKHEMREVIKLSEENIRRAGLLLEKHQNSSQALHVESRESEIVSTMPTATKTIKEPEKSLLMISHREVQTEIEDIVVGNENILNSSSHFKETSSTKKELVDSCVQTAEDKNVQTDGNLNWKSQYYFGSVYENYSNFNHVKFNQSPSKVQLDSFVSRNPAPRNLSQSFYMGSGNDARSLTPFSSISSSPKLPVPYNHDYSDDDEVMKAANKFIRSVEKRKNRNADSDITSSEASSRNEFSPQKCYSRRNSSSISTSSSSLLNQKARDDVVDVHHPVARSRNNLDNRFQAASEIPDIEQTVEKSRPFSGKPRSMNLSPSLESSQIDFPAMIASQDLLERYLSDGEVLSQGEIQLGLSDDDDEAAEDDF